LIDFKNASFLKMKPVSNTTFAQYVEDLLVPEEQTVYCFQSLRDGVVFTNRRVLAINIQGLTGKKRDITSLPYGKIQVFSIETAGVLDLDCELDLWFSGVGKVRFEFTSHVDVNDICKLISDHVL